MPQETGKETDMIFFCRFKTQEGFSHSLYMTYLDKNKGIKGIKRRKQIIKHPTHNQRNEKKLLYQ